MQGQENTEISCCCCVSGDVSAQFRIDRRGYVPGESIVVNASVQNNSNTSVSGSRVAIKQVRQTMTMLGAENQLLDFHLKKGIQD